MRTLPHKPIVSCFEGLFPELQARLETLSALRAEALERSDAPFFLDSGEQWLVRGFVGYLYEEPAPKLAEMFRRSLLDFRTAFELGAVASAWDVWDWFLYSLAVSDTASAHFLASMPEDVWWKPWVRPISWLVVRLKALFAIFDGHGTQAARLLARLRALVFDEPLPPELKDDTPDIQNDWKLLDALHRRDAAGFTSALEFRENFRAAMFRIRGGAAPVGLMDLDGLGLCRLARERGMEIPFRHPYLPFELSDVPFAEPKPGKL
jgi:hypothetical protein